jgi:hypothetical protein
MIAHAGPTPPRSRRRAGCAWRRCSCSPSSSWTGRSGWRDRSGSRLTTTCRPSAPRRRPCFQAPSPRPSRPGNGRRRERRPCPSMHRHRSPRPYIRGIRARFPHMRMPIVMGNATTTGRGTPTARTGAQQRPNRGRMRIQGLRRVRVSATTGTRRTRRGSSTSNSSIRTRRWRRPGQSIHPAPTAGCQRCTRGGHGRPWTRSTPGTTNRCRPRFPGTSCPKAGPPGAHAPPDCPGGKVTWDAPHCAAAVDRTEGVCDIPTVSWASIHFPAP